MARHTIPTRPSDRGAILTQRRRRKMARSAHAYVRGNTERFYEWLQADTQRALPQGPSIWICGDCHVGNLGPVVDGDGRLVIEGRTLPGATVRVQVDSVTSLAGIIGFTQPVADQSVQADAQGRFTVRVMPRGLPIPGTRYEVELTATRGTQTAEESLTLYQRQG